MILGSWPVLSSGALAPLHLFGCNTKKGKTENKERQTVETLCDDNLPAQIRRLIHEPVLVRVQHAEERAQQRKKGSSAPSLECGVQFETRLGHGHVPQFSPSRHKSAAERSTGVSGRQAALLEAQLLVVRCTGSIQLLPSRIRSRASQPVTWLALQSRRVKP